MKFIVILTFLSTFLFADHLYLKASNRCVYDLHPRDGSRGWCYIFTDTNRSSCSSRAKRDDFLDGYYYDVDNDLCSLDKNLVNLDISYSNYKFLMSFAGLVSGFILLLGLIYVV